MNRRRLSPLTAPECPWLCAHIGPKLARKHSLCGQGPPPMQRPCARFLPSFLLPRSVSPSSVPSSFLPSSFLASPLPPPSSLPASLLSFFLRRPSSLPACYRSGSTRPTPRPSAELPALLRAAQAPARRPGSRTLVVGRSAERLLRLLRLLSAASADRTKIGRDETADARRSYAADGSAGTLRVQNPETLDLPCLSPWNGQRHKGGGDRPSARPRWPSVRPRYPSPHAHAPPWMRRRYQWLSIRGPVWTAGFQHFPTARLRMRCGPASCTRSLHGSHSIVRPSNRCSLPPDG